MVKGIAYALGACLIWGLIFIIPQFLDGFTSIEITLGCYFFYGMISLFFLLNDLSQGKGRFEWPIWYKALYFSLISTIVYYTSIILALRFATPAICALTLGVSPIVIIFYGNWKKKECRFRTLILPSILIAIGLVTINAQQLMIGESSSTYFLGIFCAFIGLMCWAWYVIENSQFLKENPEVTAHEWSTLVGVATIFWVLVSGAILAIFFADEINIQKYYALDSATVRFFTGCGVLGLLCTWFAAFLWNRASVNLPMSLLGQLAVFETIFGLVYVYTLDGRLPSVTEYIGIFLFLSSVAYGIHSSSNRIQNSEYRIQEKGQ